MNTHPYVTRRGYPQMMDRLNRIYEYIVRHKKEHDGNSPTIREIGECIGVRSSSLIFYYLQSLEAAGLIRLEGVKARAIIVVGGKWSVE